MKRTAARIFALLMTMTVALTGCAGDKAKGTSNESITIGIPQDLDDGLDPHIVNAAGTKEIMYNIYEGLMKYDVTGDLRNALAESFEVSNDGKTYTFELKQNVMFHDGSYVTADDVVYSISRCAGIDTGTPLIPALGNIESVEKKSQTQIDVILKEPDTEFLAYMTLAVIPATNTDPETNVIGTGPYRFVSRDPQNKIELEAFDRYWGEKAKIKNITLKIESNPDTYVMDLNGGTIDMFMRITTDQAKGLDTSEFDVLEGTMNLVQALYLNNASEPFKDVRVRRALCYAVDKQQIMDFVSDGKGTAIGGAVFPAFTKYYDDSLNGIYKKDIDKAKALLKEAGYENDLSFTIKVPSNYQQHVSTAEVIVEQMKAIGVDAQIELVEWDTWLSDVFMGRNYEATVIGVDAAQLTAKTMAVFYLTGSDNNFTNYSSEEYDRLLNEALVTYDDTEQIRLFKECFKKLTEDAASVYIQDLPSLVAVRKNIGGYKFYPLYVQDYASLYLK